MEQFPAVLFLVPAIAVAAPLLASAIGRVVAIPLVVFEIVLGIVVGPDVLGWAVPTEFFTGLSNLGLAMLFFMAGAEIDFRLIRGRPMRRAVVGWLISLTLAIVVGIVGPGGVDSGIVVGIALCSTALGTLMPIIRDAGELGTPFGAAVVAVGAAGEFGPLVAISLFLSGRAAGAAAVVLSLFVIVAVTAVWLASRGHKTRLHGLVTATLHTSGQFGVRLVILMLASLVGLAVIVGLDMLLGAFAAGVVWQVLTAEADRTTQELVDTKLEGLAFGFLVPVFFIHTGITFDLSALLSSTTALILVPVFLLTLLLVRGLPGLLNAPLGASAADRRALVLFTATGLPIIVAVTKTGQDAGVLDAATAAALVGAGMLSVLLFPLTAMMQRRAGRPRGVIAMGEQDLGEEGILQV